MKTKQEQRLEILREALGECHPMPFHAMDNALVNELCEIIGSLHRLATRDGMSDVQVEEWVKASVPMKTQDLQP